MSKRPEIYVVNGPLAGSHYEVKRNGLRLGRSSSNDIHVPDEELSRNHCLFEPLGEDGVRLTDLASANGTLLNGKDMGNSPVELKVGDEIQVGKTVLRFGEKPAPLPGTVDLGLDATNAPKNDAGAAAKRRSPLANILWLVVLLCGAAAIMLVLMMPQTAEEAAAPKKVAEPEPRLAEVHYEKVQADSNGIFRYDLTLASDGVLTVRIDDVPKENRHHTKSAPLSAEALEELNEILAFRKVKEIDREYVGVDPEPPALESWTLKVVYSTRARTIRIANTQEPDAFRTIREKLEAFSKSELGIWAIQYPREKLIELAEQAVRLATTQWEDRDVKYGNLAAAIASYREALFYLETVNPQPPCGFQAREGLERATAELQQRYENQRFQADRALNLSQWETACAELRILLEMVPDRKDDRNRDARTKLLSAEANLKKGAK